MSAAADCKPTDSQGVRCAFSRWPSRLGNDLPLMHQLAGAGLFKYDLYRSAHGHFAWRSTRKIGKEVDARVFVQRYHSEVDGLRRAESPNAGVAYHHKHVDVAFAFHLFPLEAVGRAALVAPWRGRVMQPSTGSTVLQDEAAFIAGVPKRV